MFFRTTLLIRFSLLRRTPEKRTWMRLYLLLTLVVLGFFFVSPPAHAQSDFDGRQKTILMLAPQDEREAFLAILENTRSQMVGLPVEIRVRWVQSLPSNKVHQRAIASDLLTETQAALVFWCDTSTWQQVYFLFKANQKRHIIERDLEGSGDEGISDAISLITRVTVESLLSGGEIQLSESEIETVENPTSAEDSPKKTPTEKDNEPLQSQDETTTRPEQAPPKKQHDFGLLLDISYVPQIATFEPQATHGGRLSLTLWPMRHVRIGIGATVSTPLVNRDGDAEVELSRFPIHLSLLAIATMSKWSIGGLVAGMFSASQYAPKSYASDVKLNSSDWIFLFSLDFLFHTEYQFSKRVGFFLEIGVEILTDTVRFTIDDGPTLFNDLGRAQPKALLGFVFYIL